MPNTKATCIYIRKLLVIAICMLPHGTSSQERPSLQSLEVQLQQDRAANCAKADVDGDSYRPFYCDPICNCAELELNGTINSCAISGSGVEIAGDVLTQSCIVPGGFTSTACSGSSFSACLDNANCSGGEVCIDANPPFGSGFCATPCNLASDCAATSFTVSFSAVGLPTDSSPVTCSLVGGGSSQLPVNLNHNDARACLSLAGCDLCGDGVLDGNESCDDGNTTSGDGCSETCSVE